jgi:transcription elongation factor Elf1
MIRGVYHRRFECSHCGHVETVADQPREEVATVVFVVLRCPSCASDSIRTTKTRRPDRYHECACCGLKFKSVEQD